MARGPGKEPPAERDVFCTILGYLAGKPEQPCADAMAPVNQERVGLRAVEEDLRDAYGRAPVHEARLLTARAAEEYVSLHPRGPLYSEDDKARVLKIFEQTLGVVEVAEELFDTSAPETAAAASMVEDIEPISREIGVAPEKIRAVLRDIGAIQ